METADRRSGRLKWVIGFGLVAAGVAVLGTWAIGSPGALSYYATPTELKAEGDTNKLWRLGGRVADGTLKRNGTEVSFAVTDGTETVPVTFTGVVPDTLQEKTDVIAEGRLSPDGTLVATNVLAKCSSKFVPEDKKAEHLGATKQLRSPPAGSTRFSGRPD